MVRMQIQFTEEQARLLKQIAAEREVSVAALTREAVERLLVEGGNVGSAEAQSRALALMGAFEGDGSDVAENHDRYLNDAYCD